VTGSSLTLQIKIRNKIFFGLEKRLLEITNAVPLAPSSDSQQCSGVTRNLIRHSIVARKISASTDRSSQAAAYVSKVLSSASNDFGEKPDGNSSGNH
jgi:hypothetical protein